MQRTRRVAIQAFAASSILVSASARCVAQDQKGSVVKDVGDEKANGPSEAEFERDYEPPSFKPSWAKAQINRTLAQDFVIFAHSDLEMTRKLLEREPGLLNASIDWGAGDFETALGGASHMGRADIVNFLLERGSRPDLFCMAMLGKLDAVKSVLETQPNMIDAKGPHGFSLHFHAQVGGDNAKPVLDYLQSIKEIELRPVPWLKKPSVEQ